MKRREALMLLSGAGIALPARMRAQQAQKVPVVGFLHPGFPESGSPVFDALREGLREAGFIQGDNIRVEARWARGKPELLPQLARELVQLRVDVIVATARASTEAALAEASGLPLVANDLESDPVASGYVASLARPGGNLTGLYLDAPGLCSKWLQQIREVLPKLGTIAVLWDSTTGRYQFDAIVAAAKAVAVDISMLEFRDAAGLETVLESGLQQAPQAVVQLGSPLTRQAGPRVAQMLQARGVPGISQFRTFPDGGGLMSYGPDLINLYRRVGAQVSKILRGAHPSELPVERPTKFELVINLKAAKDLGVVIPAALLASADEVIE
jgi:putative ABC transport system substrate-binding protein